MARVAPRSKRLISAVLGLARLSLHHQSPSISTLSHNTPTIVRTLTTSNAQAIHDVTKVGAERAGLDKIPIHYVCGYVYCKVDDPSAVRRELLSRFAPYTGIGGRVYMSSNGMNVQLSVPSGLLREVQDALHTIGGGAFKGLRLFAMSPVDCVGDEMFTELSVRIRPLLNEGLDKSFSDRLDKYMEVMNHLSPDRWHEELSKAVAAIEEWKTNGGKKGDAPPPPIILDVRNLYEYEVGGFRGAVPVVVDAFRHTFAELDRILGLPPLQESDQATSTETPNPQHEEQSSAGASSAETCTHKVSGNCGHTSASHLAANQNPALEEAMRLIPTPAEPVSQDRKMLLYCTGGIRCMKVGAYLVSRGFKDVNVLEGGVNAYAQYIEQKYSEPQERDAHSMYRGVNVMFDERRGMKVTSDVLARCHQCGSPCDVTRNCSVHACDILLIQCDRCHEAYHGCCSKECTTKIGKEVKTELLGADVPVIEHRPKEGRVRPRLVPLSRPVEGLI